MTVTLSTRSQIVADTMANNSAKPGLMPVPNIVEPPRRHASVIRSRPAPRLWPVMNAAVATTFTPGRQDAHQLADVEPHRVVDHAVGLQVEQRVDVVGGGHAQRLDATQLTDVAADLLRRPGVAPDELERGVGGDRLH